jgi:hypothetical protein
MHIKSTRPSSGEFVRQGMVPCSGRFRAYLYMEELKEWYSKGPIGKEVVLTKR